MVTAPARPAELPQSTEAASTAAAVVASDSVAPLPLALAVVGDRWSLAIVAQLVTGPQRFNDLATACAPIARTVLSERLRRLEDSGIVSRKQYSDAPVRWNYRLTMAGAELARVCAVLADWASRHLGDGTAVLRHAPCGHDVTPAYRCSECGPVSAREIHTA